MIGTYALVSGLNGMAMVAVGAYGAHALGPEGLPDFAHFQTAWQMHAVHAAALAGISMCRRPNVWLHAGFWLMLSGSLFFSASLYARGFGYLAGGSAITPFGGLMAIAGWFALAISGAYRLSTRTSKSRSGFD